MLTLPTLTLPRKPARPQETRVAPRPHVRMAKDHVPLRRPINRPVPDDPEVEPFEVKRVRTGHTYSPWDEHEYSWDAAEARSGLVGHRA